MLFSLGIFLFGLFFCTSLEIGVNTLIVMKSDYIFTYILGLSP